MIALGLLLVLVGFATVAPRGGVTGSTAARNISIGRLHLFTTPGYQDNPSRSYRLVQVLMGIVLMVGGVLIIAVST
ncbi:MAG: hypothetical protein ABI949_04035 [Ilumatobacteraceae bacterium]